MAIVSVSEIPGRSGSCDSKLQGKRRAKYRVLMDTPYGSPEDAYNAAGVPAYYAIDPSGGGRFVLDKSAEQDTKNFRYWIVTVEYGIPPEGEDGEEPPDPEQPETRRPIWFRGTWKYTKNVIQTHDGTALLNTAGDPFGEGLDLEVGGLLYRYTYWWNTTLENQWETHLLFVNDAVWRGHAARTALLTDIQQEEERVNGTLYYKTTYEVMVKADTWDEKFLNLGMREVKGAGLLAHILDDTGKKIAGPWFLHTDGTAKRPQVPTYKTYQVRGTSNFNELW